MSKFAALIKFNKTDNIYFGCYDETCDIMYPNICTPDDCYDEKAHCYLPIVYCEQHFVSYLEDFVGRNIKDKDEIEIYVDYGNGFYWKGFGSESDKLIIEGIDPKLNYTDGIPDWAKFIERN